MVDIKDLYKKKGKKLSDDVDASKKRVEEKLKQNTTIIENLNAEIKEKLLKLQYRHNVDVTAESPKLIENSLAKDRIITLISTFGINYQRIEGKAITNIAEFKDAFNRNFEINVEPKTFDEYLIHLNKMGILYVYEENKLLFEPLSKSTDINLILRFVSGQRGNSIELKVINQAFPEWTGQKIQSLLNILENEGFVIKDNNTYWFPQLES